MGEMMLKQRVVCVDPDLIKPVHGLQDLRAFADILNSMKDEGWKGRPLLVIPLGESYQALTGSHRLVAAQEARLPMIPVIPMTLPEIAASRKSDGWDTDTDTPAYTPAIASELERRGYNEVGHFIRMDEAARTWEETHGGTFPWSSEALEYYKLAPFGRHPAIQEIMAVEDWAC